MIRFSRLLATRLRRAAFPAPRPPTTPAPLDALGRFQYALSASEGPTDVTRQRELAEENLRLAITLIGQQGRQALGHVLAACDGEVEDASTAVRVALAVARSAGHTP